MVREKRLSSDELFTFEDAKTVLSKVLKDKDSIIAAQRN